MNNKKILLIYHMNFLTKNAGNNVYAYNIAQVLKKIGYKIDFLSASFFDDYSKVNELNSKNNNLLNNIFIYQGSCEKNMHEYSPFSWVNDGFLKYFQQIINENEYDYIHIHYVNFLDFIRFSNISLKTKVIASISDFEALQQFYNSKSLENFGKNIENEIKLLDYTDEILCISNDELTFFSRFYQNKKFRLLPHFMEKKQLPIDVQKDIDCLFVGHSNLYNANAVKWFIDNVYKYLDKNTKITICGKVSTILNDTDPQYYKKMLDYQFNIIDYAQDLDELYARTKIAIVPMLAGTGLKIKTISAMSYGIPVVATSLGVDGFVDKSKSGCLVSDNEEEFAQYIKKLLNDKEFYNKKAREVSLYFDEHFSVSKGEETIAKAFSKDEKFISSRRSIYENQENVQFIPLVTIITPTYNLIDSGRKDYIIKNIESVHNQTYKNIEHIVIDGASEDGTLELLKPYEEKGLIKIFSEPDKGIYDAMNKGINKANGKYILFLNSDDSFIDINAIKESILKIVSTDSDFSYGSCNFIKGNNIIGKFISCLSCFPVHMPICHNTMLVKTKIMKELGCFDTSFRIAADYDFLIRMLLEGYKGCEINLSIVNYNIDGVSSNQALNREEIAKVFYKNFSPLVSSLSIDDCFELFDKKLIPIKLYRKIKAKVCDSLRNDMDIKNTKIMDSMLYIDKCPYLENKKTSKDGENEYSVEYKKYKPISENKLFGFLPIYKSEKDDYSKKRYILGIPYSSWQNKGEYTVTRTFFQMFKKKKSYMYSKYYFLGMQFWCKKKSKVNLLMDKVSDLQNQTQAIQNENANLKNELLFKNKELQNNIQNLQNENNDLKNELIQNIQNIQNENISFKEELKQNIQNLQNTSNELSQNEKLVANQIIEIKNVLFPQQPEIKYENFLHIDIPQGHKILEYMTQFKYYDRCLPRILKNISTKFDNFRLIDVGANIGDTAQNIRLAGLNFPILAIEGNDNYFEYLERNSSIIKNIDVCKAILAENDDTLNLQLNTQNGTGTLIKADNLTQVVSLDTLLEKYKEYKNANFIKIDTDGFDNIILKGAKNYLTNAKPIIYMEYDPNFLINNNDYGLDIFDYLISFGYKSAIMYQNYGEYMFSFSLDNKQFISEMRDFFYKNYRIYYADLLIFQEKDFDLFEEIKKQERDYFNANKL